MRRILKTKEDIEDFIFGVTLLGTGGGGDPDKGLQFLLDDLKAGRKIRVIDIDDVPNNAMTASSFYMGSIAPLKGEVLELFKKWGKYEFDQLAVMATRTLEKELGAKVKALVAVETGGLNTAAPLSIAAKLGIPAVDGDYAGRAVPELEQITAGFLGIPWTPFVLFDRFGDKTVIKEIVNCPQLERVGRYVCVAGYGLIGGAALPVRGKKMKQIIVPNTISRAIEIGRSVRAAKEKGEDPVKAIVEAAQGYLLFKGKIKRFTWEDKEGFMYGTNTIEGIEEYAGHEFKIWFKNENHVAWKDDKVVASSPDLICACLDLKMAKPTTNDKLKEGVEVAVFATKAPRLMRTKEGIAALGPRHFGFDLDYIPIEERLKS